MKIKGQTIRNDNEEIVVIPRKDNNLIFKFRPVLNFEEFDNYVKEPTPPTIQRPNLPDSLDFEDTTYKTRRFEYAIQRQNWMFIKSMMATEGLEFDSIQLNDPSTYNNIDKELEQAEFSIVERNLLYNAFQVANSLNETRLNEARESFLRSTQVG